MFIRQIAILAMVGCSFSGLARAQDVRDDFTGSTLDPANWFQCDRPENHFDIETVPGQGFRAAVATVAPRNDVAAQTFLNSHQACLNGPPPFTPEADDERAELWEADDLALRLGTEVRYEFAMLIDPGISDRSPRFVSGQWKQGGRSPFLAQRFDGHAFTVTIQQDNRSADAALRPECRIVAAADSVSPKVPGSSFSHSDQPHGSTGITCDSDVKVTTYGPLPSPFGRWVTMGFHLKDVGTDRALIEISADGKPIAKVTGRIGYTDASGSAMQYFKFGPYRDRETGVNFAKLARFRRMTDDPK
ncbi:hypothetical protein GCM10007874_06990 [Labrys miyagiensis]|uniref:Polysaccharide lyase-like protein n=1 Tax=Labrys miyagiensis TaxID=346912 RepID=A0ABQ6CG65_9HYPH|nr:heparin lyase I family protein [Labrys miyagiensis]GLS17684.1 hypothetical protein GCM10007874_06990 [Labrys miyagiensis]